MLKALWRLSLWFASLTGKLYRKILPRRSHPLQNGAVEKRIAFDPATQAVEAIHQFTNAQAARVIGLVGVDHDSGVTSASEALATRYARGRKRVLLLDACGLASASPQECDEQIAASSPVDDPKGFSRVSICPSADELLPMRDIAKLRKILREDFHDYDIIIIDTPPAHDVNGHALPATIVANACDTVLLVCVTAEVTRTLIEEACANLRAVNAPLAGVIVNRREQPTLGAEIAREARRFKKYFPVTSAKIERRALASVILNVHA
jgi:Mrp family chromosome partitioning ATPase